MSQYAFYAFISYSSHDIAWGKRLQRKLESYRMPAQLCSEKGWKRKPLNPIFFAPTDIQPGGLSAELQERLRKSKHLIVICSPHSAQSAWVGKEIAFFHSLGRTDNIHFFIVEGTPHSGQSETECFNPVVQTLGLPEILGANVNERVYRWRWMNRERAYVQLITKLLGVEFDSIWQRHKRRLVQRVTVAVLLLLVVIGALWQTWRAGQPVTVQVEVAQGGSPSPFLPPPANIAVALGLDNETKRDTLVSADEPACLTNVPHRLLGKRVRLTAACRDFLPLDTVVQLQPHLRVTLQRDASVYGQVHFTLWSKSREQPLPHVALTVGGQPVESDGEGRVSLTVPLAQQRPTYVVSSSISLVDSVIAMPHTESTVIIAE